ncbi:MAG: TolC family protein [Acidobacteria bacterium]|nr:TolC family protein [Acidobacteriota bacterium]
MRFSRITLCLTLATSLFAQSEAPVFPQPSYFRHHFTTAPARVSLRPPVRLPDFVADNTLELSLRAYLELVLVNNTDIEIQRLSVERDKNTIQRAYGVFDPILTGSFNATRTKTPASDALAGAATQNTLNQPVDFSYRQQLETGTTYNVGFSASKFSTNSSFATFNPSLTARLNFGFTQPLLRNRGRDVVRLPITIARSRMKATEFTTSDQIMRLLVTAENNYWAVINARESLRVAQENLKLTDASLKRSQRELELGALSPLEIYRPQADYARAEINVSQARFRLIQAEDTLRRMIAADLDPEIRRLPIRLTEPVLPPSDEQMIDRESAVERGLANRPDFRASLTNLQTDDLTIRQANNGLRPDLGLTGSYAASGRGGNFFRRTNVFSGDGGSSSILQMTPGGFGDALDQVFNFNYPVYAFGLTLRLPIRDRAASATLADALLTKRLDALRLRSLEQTIRQEILNAVSDVESSKASVKLAVVNRDLAQQALDAEQKKYELGVNTIFFVLDAQQRLVEAENQLVSTSVQYRRNMVSLLRATGELLEARGVVIQ